MFTCLLHVRGNGGKGDLAVLVRLDADVLLQIQLPGEDIAIFRSLSVLPTQGIPTSTALRRGSHCKCSLLCFSQHVCVNHLCSLGWFWVEGVGKHQAPLLGDSGWLVRGSLSAHRAASEWVFTYTFTPAAQIDKTRTIRHASLWYPVLIT